MILLAALHHSSSIFHTSYQFPFLGVIALLFALLGWLLAYHTIESFDIREPKGLGEPIMSFSSILIGLGLSIYGIIAGIAGLSLFIIALIITTPIILIGLLIFVSWLADTKLGKLFGL